MSNSTMQLEVGQFYLENAHEDLTQARRAMHDAWNQRQRVRAANFPRLEVVRLIQNRWEIEMAYNKRMALLHENRGNEAEAHKCNEQIDFCKIQLARAEAEINTLEAELQLAKETHLAAMIRFGHAQASYKFQSARHQTAT